MFALERRPSSETEVPYVTGILSRALADALARLSVFPLHCLKIFRKISGTQVGKKDSRDRSSRSSRQMCDERKLEQDPT